MRQHYRIVWEHHRKSHRDKIMSNELSLQQTTAIKSKSVMSIKESTSSMSKSNSTSSSPSPGYVSVSLILAVSGNSPYAFKFLASSAVYFKMTSPLASWKSRRLNKMMSPWLIQTFFRSLPRIWASRFYPSKHWASNRPLPSILVTCAYSH